MMKDLPLDLIGVAEGTDKHSLHHDYLRHYERMFMPFRHEPIDVLEIGVLDGASVRTWRQFFSRARIIGVDTNPACRPYADDRIVIEIGSQEDPSFLASLCAKYRPTIIIDDGSHQAFDIEFAFERLFPLLEPGGCYIFEDVVFHFGDLAEKFSQWSAVPLPQYIHRMEQWLMGERLTPQEERGFPHWLYGTIDRMEVIHSAVAIWKRLPRVMSNDELDQLEELVASSKTGSGWYLIALPLLRAGHADRAERACRRAMELTPTQWGPPTRLADVLQYKGDVDGAIEMLDLAISKGGADRLEFLRERVAKLRAGRQGR